MAENKPNFILMPPIEQKWINRLWRKVAITANPNLCWLWKGAKGSFSKKPYGKIKYGRHQINAHRMSYYVTYGIDPKEKCVLHKCDVHDCVNPNHLFLGTNADNVADKMKKGRHYTNVIGEANPKAKLSNHQVILIRNNFNQYGKSVFQLSKEFSVCGSTIERIVTKKTWKHI